MRYLLIAGFFALGACAQIPQPVDHAAARIDLVALDQCVARYFGVDPLGSQPRVEIVPTSRVLAKGNGATGEAFTVIRDFGPPNGAVLYLSRDVTPERVRLVMFHEYVHLYQHYRLGISVRGDDPAEDHAQKHHYGYLSCGVQFVNA